MALCTANQCRQYRKLVEEAAEKALTEVNPRRDDMEQLIKHGDGFKMAIVTAIRNFSIGKRYVDEELWSDFTYPKRYKVKPIAEQIDTLRKHFPQLSLGTTSKFVRKTLPTLLLPNEAEGWFAIPRYDRIASSYNEAVEKALGVLSTTCNFFKHRFYNYRKDRLGPQYLRQHERTVRTLTEIGEEQPSDILVIPAQFGLRHRGRSPRRAIHAFAANEFGIGTFAVACMLITHPERLLSRINLWIQCVGDEYAELANGKFSFVPCFGLGHRKVGLSSVWVGDAHAYCGTVTGFVL